MVDLEGDVASDLSAFHRIDDMYSMGSRRWARLVLRLPAYAGAVQFRLKLELAEGEQPTPPPAPALHVQAPTPAHVGGGGVALANSAPLVPSEMKGGTVVESTPLALAMSDIGDMFSFATV